MRLMLAMSLILLVSLVEARADDEINYLLEAVEGSECTFIRNGDTHDAVEAADHLRMKYERAGKRIKGAEDFIDRVASKSFLSGKPYTIRCGTDEAEPTGQWLRDKLSAYRQATVGSPAG